MDKLAPEAYLNAYALAGLMAYPWAQEAIRELAEHEQSMVTLQVLTDRSIADLIPLVGRYGIAYCLRMAQAGALVK